MASGPAEHQARIDAIVARWVGGEITVMQKRRAIAAENMQWYGQPVTRNGICLTTP
jgi:hypothetical protein